VIVGEITGRDLRKMLQGAVASLEQNKEQVNALNVFPVPDGDTGTNMYLTLSAAVREALQGSEDLAQVAAAASTGSLMGARGNSGVILSQLFRGLSQGLAGHSAAGPREVAQALVEASRTAYRAVMKPVEGTILTVARVSAQEAQKAARAGGDVEAVLQAAVNGAKEALARTPSLLSVLRDAGVVDAGGQGLVFILEGALAALQGKEYQQEASFPQPVKEIPAQDEVGPGQLAYGYCTEALLRGAALDPDSIRQTLSVYGDSLLVVGDAGLAKVHIHTNQPGRVLEELLQLGTLHDIKIDNMLDQHRTTLVAETPSQPKPEKALGVVAVATGDGLKVALEGLGVDVVVSGGQTMNPSTEELLAAVESVMASSVLILPNNKNVILAAQQVAELTTKQVAVIPTKSVPQGIAALVAFNPELGLEENAAAMTTASQSVKTGEITYAVRSTQVNGCEIQLGDILGLIDGKLVTTGREVEAVALDVLDQMVEPDNELITVFTGEEIEDKQAVALATKISQQFTDCEVEFHRGGQPLYYYILAVE
jgi:DAK2 domain fusion protein YloV